MKPYLRLRQICLAIDDLPRAMADIVAIFGVSLAHEDPHVAAYGVRNAVYPFGLSFIELVAPLHEQTTASRFVRRGGHRGAYMAIFNCNDPRRRANRLRAMGLRIAAEIEVENFYAIQLHPRDGRATMIELDCTMGEENLRGPYFAAGGIGWTGAIRTDVTRGIADAVIQSPAPLELCEHWARILERPYQSDSDGASIEVELCRLRFSAGETEALTSVGVEVCDVDAALARAVAQGYRVQDGRILDFCGVDLRLLTAT